MTYPYAFPSADSLRHCAHVTINSGQWPFGWPDQRVWSLGEYVASIHELFDKVVKIQTQQQKIFFWVDTNSLLFHNLCRTCRPKDWRHPHIIVTYNNAKRRGGADRSPLCRASGPALVDRHRERGAQRELAAAEREREAADVRRREAEARDEDGLALLGAGRDLGLEDALHQPRDDEARAVGQAAAEVA